MLLFILIVTTLKFFTMHLDYLVYIPFQSGGGFTFHLPIGSIIAAFVWGGIFWCYAEIVCATGFDIEPLPQVTFSEGFGYLFAVLKSLYSFFVAFVVVFLPAIIANLISQSKWFVLPFIILGMFLFPMSVMIVSISRDLLMLFRPDYFFTPIRKAFWHYLFLAGLFVLTWQLQYISLNYRDIIGQPNSIILLHLLVVLAIQILAIVTMRATGLFYRHFACYFGW